MFILADEGCHISCIPFRLKQERYARGTNNDDDRTENIEMKESVWPEGFGTRSH